MIRHALSSIPVKPVLWIAPVVIVLGLVYHYWGAYARCTYHADLRDRLQRAIADAGASAGSSERRLRLADVVDFDWDRVSIAVGFRPDGRTPDCPFGWDWSSDERARLGEEGRLVLFAFSRRGQYVDYLEYRRDWADFEGVEAPLTPETAVFEVRRPAAGAAAVLRPVGP